MIRVFYNSEFPNDIHNFESGGYMFIPGKKLIKFGTKCNRGCKYLKVKLCNRTILPSRIIYKSGIPIMHCHHAVSKVDILTVNSIIFMLP